MLEIETEIPTWKVKVVEDESELPIVTPEEQIFFMDFETTLYDKERLATCHRKSSLGAFFPYLGDRIAGAAVVYGKENVGYYIPVRHKGFDSARNISEAAFTAWLKTHNSIPKWCNANVKFDAHFAHIDGFDYEGELLDCLVSAKIHNAEAPSHALKYLLRRWLEMPMTDEIEIKNWLKEAKTGDYGELPIDICATYAVLDCFGARALEIFCRKKRPEGVDKVVDIERAMTKVLFNIERRGMIADRRQLLIEMKKCLSTMIDRATTIYDLTGTEFTDSSTNIYTMLCVQNGLPILSYTSNKDKTGQKVKGGPSFDAEALEQYSNLPTVKVDSDLSTLVESIREYRKDSNFKSMFLEPYLRLQDNDGLLHPNYVQIIRTGRMACGTPNAQQLNKRAKRVIVPGKGFAFISFDASQVEFRVIVHYIRDPDAIAAYRDNPNTDFHQWVADNVRFEYKGQWYKIDRGLGKTLNFAMAFGAGKRKVQSQVAGADIVIEIVNQQASDMVESGQLKEEERIAFISAKCYSIASSIYEAYHNRFPGIKRVSNLATNSVKHKGYAQNLFGRRRPLTTKRAHIAFNTAVQGSAMDIIKERMTILDNDKFLLQQGIEIVASVHDEILFRCPIQVATIENARYINTVLCETSIPLRVPLSWDGGISNENWYLAANGETVYDELNEYVSGRIPGKLLR